MCILSLEFYILVSLIRDSRDFERNGEVDGSAADVYLDLESSIVYRGMLMPTSLGMIILVQRVCSLSPV